MLLVVQGKIGEERCIVVAVPQSLCQQHVVAVAQTVQAVAAAVSLGDQVILA